MIPALLLFTPLLLLAFSAFRPCGSASSHPPPPRASPESDPRAGVGDDGGGGGDGAVEEATGFKVGIMVPNLSRLAAAARGADDCMARLVRELEGAGLLVERIRGVPAEFIKLAAPMGTLGKAAAEMQMKKLTYIGMDLQFEWDQVAAFVKQPDGSLFSRRERHYCFRYLIYGIVNRTNSEITLKFHDKEFHWKENESLLTRLESEGVVKQVFPLHDEIKRKQLLRNWALNWFDFAWQPIDEIYSYFGTKVCQFCQKQSENSTCAPDTSGYV